MIRLGQHRHLPRQRFISEQGWLWIGDAFQGLFTAAAIAVIVLASQYWPQIKALAGELHVAVLASGHVVKVWP